MSCVNKVCGDSNDDGGGRAKKRSCLRTSCFLISFDVSVGECQFHVLQEKKNWVEVLSKQTLQSSLSLEVCCVPLTRHNCDDFNQRQIHSTPTHENP